MKAQARCVYAQINVKPTTHRRCARWQAACGECMRALFVRYYIFGAPPQWGRIEELASTTHPPD